MAVAAPPKKTGIEAEAVLGKAYDLRLIRRLWKYVRPHFALQKARQRLEQRRFLVVGLWLIHVASSSLQHLT